MAVQLTSRLLNFFQEPGVNQFLDALIEAVLSSATGLTEPWSGASRIDVKRLGHFICSKGLCFSPWWQRPCCSRGSLRRCKSTTRTSVSIDDSAWGKRSPFWLPNKAAIWRIVGLESPSSRDGIGPTPHQSIKGSPALADARRPHEGDEERHAARPPFPRSQRLLGDDVDAMASPGVILSFASARDAWEFRGHIT